MHLPFRLETSKGGELYLFKGAQLVDCIQSLPKMLAPNVSMGRNPSGDFVWQLRSTPGLENCPDECKGILPEPVFSHSGVVNPSESLTVNLSFPDAMPVGTKIHYTLDGTDPTPDSPIWQRKLHIMPPMVIKAALFCDGYLTPPPTTESFLDLEREMTLPVVSITADPDYFYGEDLGILLGGDVNQEVTNYLNEWRRPVNIEIFDAPDSPSVINQLGETRVKGGGSRGYELKSLVIYAHKRFGTKLFQYEFFPEDAPGLTD